MRKPLLTALLVLTSLHAQAATLRCPNHGIADKGDRTTEVLQKCGTPVNQAVTGHAWIATARCSTSRKNGSTAVTTACCTSCSSRVSDWFASTASVVADADHSRQASAGLEAPPVITLLLILLNTLIYFGYQGGDEERREQAVQAYLDKWPAEP